MGAAAGDACVTDQTPILLITRPAPEAARLADEVRRACPGDFDIVLSPLIGIEPVSTTLSPEDFEAVIFTSVNGVIHAADRPLRPGQPAFCVGDRTAQAARDAGYDARSAGGAAADLTRLILSTDIIGPMIHLRGAETRGDIAENLRKTGRNVTSAIVYGQRPLPLTHAARGALTGKAAVILPLYSPNTAKALLNQGPYSAPLQVIAISEAVAEAASDLSPAAMSIASHPDGPSMVASICAGLGGKSGRSGP